MTIATFETGTDKWRALAFALLLHVFAVGMMVTGLSWQREPPSSSGVGEIEATLITSPSAVAVSSTAQAADKASRHDGRAAPAPPQPKPEPQTPQDPPQLKLQQVQDQPEILEQQRVSALAVQTAEQQKKEQDEKLRQQQILQRQQAQDAVENKQRLAAPEQQRLDPLDAIPRQSAQADQNRKLADEQPRQSPDQSEHCRMQSPVIVGQAMEISTQECLLAAQARETIALAKRYLSMPDDDLHADYLQTIQRVVYTNWITTGIPDGVHCHVHFTQMVGGKVMQIRFRDCPLSARARGTIEDALRKEPMPYIGFETVFSTELSIELCHPQQPCAATPLAPSDRPIKEGAVPGD